MSVCTGEWATSNYDKTGGLHSLRVRNRDNLNLLNVVRFDYSVMACKFWYEEYFISSKKTFHAFSLSHPIII